MSRTNIENADSVDFGKMKLTTTLNGGFDSDTPKEYKREVTLHFVGFDKADNETKETLLEELAAKLRIKINQAAPSGVLKGRPEVYDAESYAEMLDANDCKFTFDVSELYATTSRTLSAEQKFLRAAKQMLDEGTISQAQYDSMVAAAND